MWRLARALHLHAHARIGTTEPLEAEHRRLAGDEVEVIQVDWHGPHVLQTQRLLGRHSILVKRIKNLI